MSITPDQLRKIWTHAPAARCALYAPLLSDAMARFEIDTRERVVQFLAQVSHESGEGRYVEEIASGAAYEGRKDLGNSEPGDGIFFKGHGLIQCTGRRNHLLMGMMLDLDLIANPRLLCEPKNATDSAAAFWWNNYINTRADKQDFVAVTRAINGGTNGLADRQQYLKLARAAITETA
jgi:putative chitinase